MDIATKSLFKLRFHKKAIREWATHYPIDYDSEIENLVAPQVKARGYFLRDEFIRLGGWKTPRSQPKVASNPADYVEEVTRTALSTPNERLRIEVLLLLNGVCWPTASVILHFAMLNTILFLTFVPYGHWVLMQTPSHTTLSFGMNTLNIAGSLTARCGSIQKKNKLCK